jgi:N-acetylglutamate synthase-like GNAT family acetyltransferase
MDAAAPTPDSHIRKLAPDDVERVIAIDRVHSGHARRRFFERRFAAAEEEPGDYIQLGVMRGGSLRGFAIARILRGEFGREHVAVLDALGVEAESQERGIGHALMQGLMAAMRDGGVRVVQSQADWTNHNLLRFFAGAGFELAPRLSLQREVGDLIDETGEEV